MPAVAKTRPEVILAARSRGGQLPTSFSGSIQLIKGLDLEALQGPDLSVYFEDHDGRVRAKMKAEKATPGDLLQFYTTMEQQALRLAKLDHHGRNIDFHAHRGDPKLACKDAWDVIGTYEGGVSITRYPKFMLLFDILLLLYRGGDLEEENRKKIERRLALYVGDHLKFLCGLDDDGRAKWLPLAPRLWTTIHAYHAEGQLIQITKLANLIKDLTFAEDQQTQYLHQFICALGKTRDMGKLIDKRFRPSVASKEARVAWSHKATYSELSISTIW